VPKARQELYETGLWNFDSKNSTIGDAHFYISEYR